MFVAATPLAPSVLASNTTLIGSIADVLLGVCVPATDATTYASSVTYLLRLPLLAARATTDARAGLLL